MNKLLVLLVLYLASVNCVELENICSDDAFDFDGVKVNAFHRVVQRVGFQGLRHYLISDLTILCDPTEFQNRNNYWEALGAKNRFNHLFAKFYSETELSDARAKEFGSIVLELENAALKPLEKMKRVEEKNTQCVQAFEEKVRAGIAVFKSLKEIYALNILPRDESAAYTPTYSKRIQMLQELLEKFWSSREFALRFSSPTSVYNYKLIHPRGILFLTEERDSVGPDTKGMVIFDYYLPFYNDKHTDQNCVPAKILPLLFKNKGKRY